MNTAPETAPDGAAPVGPAAAPAPTPAAGPAPTPAAGPSGGKVRVAVVFGGRSGEHPVSCATAAGVLRAIDRDRYDVLPIGITRAGEWVLVADDPARLEGGRAEVSAADAQVLVPLGERSGGLVVAEPGQVPRELGAVDVVMPLLHGPFGEDGTLQGLLEMAGVRYVGSGVLASAAGMDKHYMKVILAGHGLPVGPYTVITPRTWRTDKARALDAAASLGFPVFVKPARAGSSLGISKVERPEDLEAAIAEAQRHDPKVIVEAGIDGREIECAVLEGHGDDAPRTTVPGEIVLDAPASGFYDYETKYLDTAPLTMAAPADLPEDVAAQVRALAADAFDALGCEGLARVDFFYDGRRVIINEVNTMPGFTPFSMYPLLWEKTGLSYPELIDELIQLARERDAGLR
ncbi:D-alanine--D-alanine ligase family protein [Georgenia ruanii]|uniref:D-alanine--D-alanine ligase n=1 Tax=Georgenia ruanii TaxID=348442 RepID=A0A7J9V0G2_9MICO|nr:D-alanine--D-alanine ligase family protein [Georgenia ruanii]MPV89454.1 D-alanine--D-alanine ligase [Georgenia ruanii]